MMRLDLRTFDFFFRRLSKKEVKTKSE